MLVCQYAGLAGMPACVHMLVCWYAVYDMPACLYASMPVYVDMPGCQHVCHAGMKVYASMPACQHTSMPVCQHAGMLMWRYMLACQPAQTILQHNRDQDLLKSHF